MDRFELPFRSSWLWQVFGRNPLVRSSDRLEAMVIFMAVLAIIVMMPVAGAVGTAVDESQATAAAEVAATRHHLTAVVTVDSAGVSGQNVLDAQTSVRWVVGNDVHTALVHSRYWHKAVDSVDIWVDDHGVVAPGPPSSADQTMVAVFAAVVVWSTGLAAGVAMVLVARAWLNHLRYAAWEAECNHIAGDGGSHQSFW